MPAAIFGITNNGLNLAVSLFVLMLVVVWLALIVYTFLDARRRISDPVLVACATAASLFPYIGTIVYVIVRPPEFIEDSRERELEMKASALRVRQLAELSCPNCEYPIEKNFLRCPIASAASRTPARPAASRSIPAGRSAPTARRRCPGAGASSGVGGAEEGRRQQQPRRQQRAEPAEARPEPKAEAACAAQETSAPAAGDGADSAPERPKASEPRPPSRRSKSQSGASRQSRERNS